MNSITFLTAASFILQLASAGLLSVVPEPRKSQEGTGLPPPVVPEPRQGQEGTDLPPPVVPEPRQGQEGTDLPPPVVPEPRQGQEGTDLPPPVVPEPRQIISRADIFLPSIGSQAIFRSPNYPNSYPNNSTCLYNVRSVAGSQIRLTCRDFNVQEGTACEYDALYISPSGDSNFRDAVKVCGRRRVSAISRTNFLPIGFFSDNSNPFTFFATFRFSCVVVAVQSTFSSVAPVTSTTTVPVKTTTTRVTTTSTTQASTNSSICSCGVRNEVPRIVGGIETLINEFPWRCALYSPKLGYFCGSTVISENWILTAAHCTAAVPTGATLQVYCSDHNIRTATETARVIVNVKKIVQHASYNSNTQDNDISLIQLATPLKFSRTIQPACLPYNMVGKSVEGLTVVASGWGTTSSGGKQSDVLLKVDLPVLSIAQCQRYYGTSVTGNMICTYKPGSDTCQGDSGGSIDIKNPDTGRYHNLGVVSWGVGCAERNRPGVYADVRNYLNWIESKTGESFCKP